MIQIQYLTTKKILDFIEISSSEFDEENIILDEKDKFPEDGDNNHEDEKWKY